MKTHLLKLICLAFLTVALGSCTQEEEGIFFEKIAESKTSYSKMELEILNLINNYRKTKGIPELKSLLVISSVAQSHTKYMIKEGAVSHDNFPQRNENLVNSAGAKSVGENVAYGYGTAQGVVNGWLKSSAHKAIIESTKYTHFGISTEKNAEGRNYFTQMFIER